MDTTRLFAFVRIAGERDEAGDDSRDTLLAHLLEVEEHEHGERQHSE